MPNMNPREDEPEVWAKVGPVTVKKVTPQAALFILDDGQEVWVPKSQCHPNSLAKLGDGVDLEVVGVKQWICDKDEIPYYGTWEA